MTEDKGIFSKFDLMYGVARAESFNMMNDADAKSGMSVRRSNEIVKAYVTNNYEHVSLAQEEHKS